MGSRFGLKNMNNMKLYVGTYVIVLIVDVFCFVLFGVLIWPLSKLRNPRFLWRQYKLVIHIHTFFLFFCGLDCFCRSTSEGLRRRYFSARKITRCPRRFFFVNDIDHVEQPNQATISRCLISKGYGGRDGRTDGGRKGQREEGEEGRREGRRT